MLSLLTGSSTPVCEWGMFERVFWVRVGGESRRGDVRLRGDTLTPLLVNRGSNVVVVVVCKKRLLLLLLLLLKRRRRTAAAAAALDELTGQLAELIRICERLQHSVLALQHRVPLVQLFDVLLQHLHLLTNSVHQMALYQVLKERKRQQEKRRLANKTWFRKKKRDYK